MNFIRYDPKTGSILNSGQMREDIIDRLILNGETNIIKTSDRSYTIQDHYVDLNTKTVKEKPKVSYDPSLDVIDLIKQELARTDYTQAADNSDHLTPKEVESWRVYRNTIRTAMNAGTYEEMVKMLPIVTPKNVESPFVYFKEQKSS